MRYFDRLNKKTDNFVDRNPIIAAFIIVGMGVFCLLLVVLTILKIK
jgi:hypothetical protein